MVVYVLLQLLGPSMLPAIIALSVHNGAIVGYLMGRHADALEYRPDAPRGVNLYCYETVPRLYGQFLAYALYRWEIMQSARRRQQYRNWSGRRGSAWRLYASCNLDVFDGRGNEVATYSA